MSAPIEPTAGVVPATPTDSVTRTNSANQAGSVTATDPVGQAGSAGRHDRDEVVRYWCPVVWTGMVGAGDGEPAGLLRDVVIEVVGGTIAAVRGGGGRAPGGAGGRGGGAGAGGA